MSNYNNEIVNKISDKIQHLISLYEKTSETNTKLLNRTKELEEENKILKEKVEIYGQEISKIKFAKAVEGKGEVEDVKKMISKLVKDIDNCISLLNQ